MIDTIFIIVKILLAILPFALLCFVSKKVNLPQTERSKQFFMPIISLAYVLITMYLLGNINDWLIKLISNIPDWIASPADFSWMPEFLGDIFIKIGDLFRSLIAAIDLNFWIFFIANIVIILVYLLIKKISIIIISKAVKTDGEFHTKVAQNFYEYFAEKNKWCIKENYVQARTLLKVLYYGAVCLSCILMLISSFVYYGGLFKTVFYPVFGILIVGELYFYLDGATKREYSEDILGEDEDAYKTVNYSLLRKFLRSIFGDKLLAENTSINSALAYGVTTDEILRELENSEDEKTVCFATYFNALNKTGFQIDHNYLHSSLDLLNGKSILFNNPFYNDLVPYAFYPLNRVLLSHQKVLVVLGRHAVEEDIIEWIQKGIEAITNIPFLWKIGVLSSEKQDIDIGIITRSDVLDINLHNANSEFLENVGFCVVIEPSKLISTAQIGLNMLVEKCNADDDKNIVYCMCDKNCDGLVDAMSHVLKTSITEVSATQKHLGTSSYMCWEADEEYLHHRLVPNISRYLGMGTELSFAALKNQVSKTTWYGGEAFPVTDIRWIDKQYYYDLTKYASLPTNQETIDECFVTSPNFWSAKVEKNNYLTVEDESNNMFEVLREFSTRTTEQGFINIISSEYLLKDYMADNASIFETDAKAIPYIVADFTRSNRNTVLRLILMMSTFPVSSEILEKELSLLGITVFDIKKQLWFELYNCYSKVSEISAISEDYRQAVDKVYFEKLKIGDSEWASDIITLEETFNLKSGKLETMYSIADKEFLKQCVAELRNAGYVAEDEKGQYYYLGSELSGHIYQKYLPGQFFTFGGKYYEMQYLTADGQVLVRRAADHITGRHSYRQIRKYTISGVRPSEKVGSQQDIAGMKVVKEFADIVVETPGYYRMERYNDFATAKKIKFDGENNGIKKRLYNNKEILRIELPDLGGKLNDNVRYTITLIFNEIFKTIFAENQAYICAVTDDSFLAETAEDSPLTYSVNGDGYEVQKNSIYIIEDSQLDLGLTVAVERNLQRIFSIIHDYLEWHMETLELSLNPPPDPQPPIIFGVPEEGEEDGETPKKKGIKGIFSKIKGFFGKIKNWIKKKLKKGEEPPVDDVPTDTGETPEGEEVPKTGEGSEAEKGKKKKGIFGFFRRKKTKPSDDTPSDDTPSDDTPSDDTPSDDTPSDDTPEGEIVPEDKIGGDKTEGDSEETDPASEESMEKDTKETVEAPFTEEIIDSVENDSENKGFAAERKPYHERYYLLFGKDYEPSFVDVSGTLDYLSEMGLQRNPLKQAREGKNIAEFIEETFKPGKPDARYCDFCGVEIFGVEYETLADGRDRCMNCSRTSIKTGEEFRKIFEDVKRNMESFFGIRINTGIKVEMVNSKTLHKRLGKSFVPTAGFDGRVLGVAINDKNGFTLLVENGSPRMASMLTMAHELTHIWQYINWDEKALLKKYGKDLILEVYEGMAKWVEVQYAYLINEPATAKREEIITSYRDDEYGHGFLRYRANYPFSLGTVITKKTPFMDVETPLSLEFCVPFVVTLPTNGINQGDIDNQTIPKKPTPGGYTPGRHTPPVVTPNPLKGPIERNPNSLNRYAYSLLDDSEKACYDALLEAINNFAAEVNEFNAPITDAQTKKIVRYIHVDHPEIFWFQNGATYYYDTTTNVVSRIELRYCMTPDEAKSRQEEINSAKESFLSSVNDTMSDYELTLRIYENIIKLVDYDTISLEKQEESDKSGDVPDDLRSIYGVLVNKKAVCAGYSKAFQYLLNSYGIECTYITSDTHAWNLIKLEGDYYHIDITWGDGSNTKKEKSFSDAVSYECFCLTTAEVSALEMHIPEEHLPLPECTATKCNYYRRHGLYFEKYDLNKIKSIVCESIKRNELEISFKFASQDVKNEAKRQLIDNGKFREVIQFASLKTKTKLDLSYRYATKDEKLFLRFYISKI